MRIQRAHQFYRDVFTTPLVPARSWEATSQPHLMHGRIDEDSARESLMAEDRTLALLATYCNLFHDRNLRAIDHAGIHAAIRFLCDRLLEESPSAQSAVTAAKALLRSNQIDAFLSLARARHEELARDDAFKAMLSMVRAFEEDYASAVDDIGDLLNSADYKDHFLVKILGMTALYKLGEAPQEPLNLAHIVEENQSAPPSIDWVTRHNPANEAIVFVACDDAYLREHALYNFLSFARLHEAGSSWQYHFHLYNPSAEALETIAKLQQLFPRIDISASRETLLQKPEHLRPTYTINRFAAIHGIVEEARRPVLGVDADSLWRQLPPVLQGSDLALCEPDNAPFWEGVLGGAAYFTPSAPSTFMLSLMTAFIQDIHARRQSLWFQDQLALKISNEVTQRKFSVRQQKLSPEIWCDTDHRDDAILWQVTTRKDGLRFAQFKQSLVALIR